MTDFRKTLIGRGDSYKYSHFMQYPEGIQNNASYIEARGYDKDIFPQEPEVVFFGIQAFIKEYMSTPLTHEMVYKVEKMMLAHGEPFHSEGWHTIVDEFDGYLPLLIMAIPEGRPVAVGTPMLQVEATDDRFAWLASFVETAMIRAIWYPTTVATISREIKKTIHYWLDKTCDDEAIDDVLAFRLHDFGARGATTGEAASLGGLAHLINFMGTDTVEALWAAEDYYGANGPVGFSIPASEHSTITSWGKDNESKAYANMIDKYASDAVPLIACVSDSYDFRNAVTNIWGKELKQKVLDSGATLVVRPDSGDPVEEAVWAVQELGRLYGTSENGKGYKVLHPSVRVIQGDGINHQDIYLILHQLWLSGYSAENIAFGMGGALLQKLDRDTLKFAQKTCAAKFDGEWKDVYKSPTGTNWKKSKRGMQNPGSVLWANGQFHRETDFDTIRANAAI